MIFQGQFKNRDNNKTYKVTIGNTGVSKTIVDPLDRTFKYNREQVLFAEDPVVITCERDELQQQILIRQATINLKANYDLSSYLFADTNRSIPVVIQQKVNNDWVSVFNGYVDPLQFNQGIAYNFESYTVHATDPLGALNDLKVNSLNNIRRIDSPSLKTIVEDIAETIGCELDLTQWVNSPNSLPDDLVANMSIFYGDSEDDFMTLYDTLDNILRYIGAICYYNPVNDKMRLMNMYVSTSTNVDFNLYSNAMDASSTLSTDDVYNQVKLKCNIEPTYDDIDLIGKDELYSKYNNYQKFMTELVCPGEGERAYDGFREYLNSEDNNEYSTYSNAYKVDHYCQVMLNNAWDFGEDGYTSFAPLEDQSDYLLWLKNHTGKAMFINFGLTNKQNKKDTNPIPNINMSNYFVLSINGHDDQDQNGHVNTYTQIFDGIHPVCTYNGLKQYTLTPTDDKTTNYIVISGKIILNPLQEKSGTAWSTHYDRTLNTYKHAKIFFNPPWINDKALKKGTWHSCVPNDENGDGAYYTHKWFSCAGLNTNSPIYTLKGDGDPTGTIPFLNINKNKEFEYEGGFYNTEADKLSKVPVIACRLKIGDMYCVERLDKGKSGQNVFEWLTLEECNQLGIEPNFSLGIDPTVNDYLIGQTFSISNTVKEVMNISSQGMAIPITTKVPIGGVPEFSILGAYNNYWSGYTATPYPFSKAMTVHNPKYGFILEKLDSIIISDLKIQFNSDNARNNDEFTTADNDLVYCSDMMPMYIEDREDDLCICTPLTIEECMSSGIKYQISDSYIYYDDKTAFHGWSYNSDIDIVKPEQMWVDYMYKQYCQPKKILTTSIRDDVFVPQQSSVNDIGKWMTNGTIKGTLGTEDSSFSKGFLKRVEWSLKDRSMNIDIREAADYEPVWQTE